MPSTDVRKNKETCDANILEGMNSTCFIDCSGEIWAVIGCYKSCCGARYLIIYERQTFMNCKQSRTNEWEFTFSSWCDLRVSSSPWRCSFLTYCKRSPFFGCDLWWHGCTIYQIFARLFPKKQQEVVFFENKGVPDHRNCSNGTKKRCVCVIASWSRTRNYHQWVRNWLRHLKSDMLQAE